MSAGEFRYNGEGLEIRVRGASTRFSGMDLHTAAIVELIEAADTGFEEKIGDPEAPWEFYAAVLAGVARHYVETASQYGDDVDEDRQSAGEILQGLLGELRRQGRL
jgi:hypothetical protein